MSDWSEVVVVEDMKRWGSDKPGRYALVRAADWCAYGDTVRLWRGPKRPDEIVKTDFLMEVTCKTLLVTPEGFYDCVPSEEHLSYPCPQVTEDLKDEVRKQSEEILDGLANQQAAEMTSSVDYERTRDVLGDAYGDDIWAYAEFHDRMALNGEPVSKRPKPPRGWKETELGGRTDGGESEIQKEDLIGPVTSALSEKLKLRLDWNTVRRILEMIYPREYVYWSSGYGDSQVFVSKDGMRRLEAIEERRLTENEKIEREKAERERKEREERRRREIEEYRAKLRKGGALAPREWSPRGLMPGERE